MSDETKILTDAPDLTDVPGTEPPFDFTESDDGTIVYRHQSALRIRREFLCQTAIALYAMPGTAQPIEATDAWNLAEFLYREGRARGYLP